MSVILGGANDLFIRSNMHICLKSTRLSKVHCIVSLINNYRKHRSLLVDAMPKDYMVVKKKTSWQVYIIR